MGYMDHQITVHLPIREDDTPLTQWEILEQVHTVVSKAVTEWYEKNPEVQESLAYEPEVAGI